MMNTRYRKIIVVFLVTLLTLYPIYTFANNAADVSPNMPLLGNSGGLGQSSLGSSGENSDDFLENYIIDAPDRKIPIDFDFNLSYGISVSDKSGEFVEHTISVLNDGEFNPTVVGSYTIHYEVQVKNYSDTFTRVIAVTPYKVEMNSLVIVKESTNVPEKTVYEEDSKESDSLDFDTSESSQENESTYHSNIPADGIYYVSPADASIIDDSIDWENILNLSNTRTNKSKENKELSILGESISSPSSMEDVDILSASLEGAELEPLDLRYGITVLNSENGNITQHIQVIEENDFSMETENHAYDVDYAIVYEGNVVVEFNRTVNVLSSTRATGAAISDMVMTQTVLGSDGTPVEMEVTWKADGDFRVFLDGERQYASGPGSGTVLRFLDEPLEVAENKPNGTQVTHQIVGENIHSFMGYYVSNLFSNNNNKNGAFFDFKAVNNETVTRRGFVGADDNSKQSPILADGELELRNKIANVNLIEEFDVFRQIDDTDNLSMTRVYKYYPNANLLNKTTTGQILNDKPLFELEVTARFDPGEMRVLREITITNLAADYYNASGNSPVFQGHLMYMADTYFDQFDNGFGFRSDVDDSVYVRGVKDGSRTMLLKGHQPSEASFVGAWYITESTGVNAHEPEFIARYQEVYGETWFNETMMSRATLSNAIPNGSGGYLKHTLNPHYSMNSRTPFEGELPKQLNSMAYPVTKTLYASDIPPRGTTAGSNVNGSIDMAYAMQWALPPTAVGESYTFVIEENWIEDADLQIGAPKREIIPSGDSKTLRFTAENTHMYDYATPLSQEWDLDTDFIFSSKNSIGDTVWPLVIEKIYKEVSGNLVEVPFTGTSTTHLKVKPGEKYYFDVKVTVNEKALGGHENEIILTAKTTNQNGNMSESHGSVVIEAESLAEITDVYAAEISNNKIVARVEFNNPHIANPQDPTVLYNTTVRLYDINNVLLSTETGRISFGGKITFTGLTLVEGGTYKLVATAEPEAMGTVDYTFQLIAEEAKISYLADPDYAITSGMPSPLSVTKPYMAGKADFTISNSSPSAVGLVFKGWKDTDTGTVYASGSTFSMLLTELRREATLITTWDIDPTYKITVNFDNNEGIGTIPHQTKSVGDVIDVPTESISKTGYKLIGWTTDKNISSTKWNFKKKLSGIPQTITLYASWELDPDSWEVRIVEVPDLVFKKTKISSGSKTIPLNMDGVLKIRDTYPGNHQGWSLNVSASQLITNNNVTLDKDSMKYFDSMGQGQSIYYNSTTAEGSPVNIWNEASSSTQFDYQRTFTTNLANSFGVSVFLDEVKAANYDATLTWSVVLAP